MWNNVHSASWTTLLLAHEKERVQTEHLPSHETIVRFIVIFPDMVEFVRAVQESSRPSTADSTSTSDETSGPTTAGAEEETEDKDKDEDEAMSLDWSSRGSAASLEP